MSVLVACNRVDARATKEVAFNQGDTSSRPQPTGRRAAGPLALHQ